MKNFKKTYEICPSCSPDDVVKLANFIVNLENDDVINHVRMLVKTQKKTHKMKIEISLMYNEKNIQQFEQYFTMLEGMYLC